MNTDALRTGCRWAGTATVVAAVVLFILIAVPGVIGAEASYVVLSDSMEPAFSAGDVIVVQSVPPAAIATGDIITYQAPQAESGRISHRVVEINQADGERTFRTKGDANEQPDPYQVSESGLTGRVWFAIPYAGYIVRFAGTTLGQLLLIALPGALLVVSELWSVYQDAVTDPTDSK